MPTDRSSQAVDETVKMVIEKLIRDPYFVSIESVSHDVAPEPSFVVLGAPFNPFVTRMKKLTMTDYYPYSCVSQRCSAEGERWNFRFQ